MITQCIRVFGYESYEDREQKINATLIGDAKSKDELKALMKKAHGKVLDYEDRAGKSLYLEEAEQQLGYYRPLNDASENDLI